MAEKRLRALIADDEPLARAYLKKQLETQGVQIVAEAGTAAEALQLVQAIGPDLLFLDIRMPGLTGIQCAGVLMNLDVATQVIFVTGYSEYALDAYECNALDYLVKPVPPERLAASLARARQRLATVNVRQQLDSESAPPDGPDTLQRRLPVREEFGIRLIRLSDIVYATARDKRVFIKTAQAEHRTFYTLAQLETLLPQEQFFRTHESWLVNLDQIEELCLLGSHSYVVRLTDRQTLPVSRYRYADLIKRLRIDEKP